MPVGDPSPPADDPLIGRVLSERYRILRKVGEGGMGTVYQAEHALIEKKIALKVLFPELTRRADLVARFLQEAKSASRIGHENVIDISDFGQSPEGMVFIAMEYLEGQDLGQRLKADGPMKWARARPILMQIAKALRAAHEHGIVHRDVKPENVFLVQREGRPDFVKVLDFGIAKVVNDTDGPRLTQTGMIFGTPEYMSPEQAQGQPSDHRVDVYAVGCLMYEMLTGDVPFHADNFMGTLTEHMHAPPVPPRQRRPDLDIAEDVEAVCLRALEKDREKRWQDMDAFYRALGGAGGEAFEPSGAYVPYASLRPPAPEAGVTRRGLHAGGSPLEPSSPSGDEPSVVRRSAGFKLGVVIAGVVVVAVLLIQVLHRAGKGETVAAPPSAAPPAESATSNPQGPLPSARPPAESAPTTPAVLENPVKSP
jgi:serine/threonine-protein kinase